MSGRIESVHGIVADVDKSIRGATATDRIALDKPPVQRIIISGSVVIQPHGGIGFLRRELISVARTGLRADRAKRIVTVGRRRCP